MISLLRCFSTVVAILFFTGELKAFSIIADLSPHSVDITSEFNGAKILVFGTTVKKIDGLVIIVHGPEKNVVARKKKRILGVWVNAEKVILRDVKQFYSIMHTKIDDSIRLILRNQLRLLSDKWDFEYFTAFEEWQKKNHLYQISNDIILTNDHLFRGNVYLPSNIIKGKYFVELLAFRDGEIVGIEIIPLFINKRGLDAWLYDMHYIYPFYYAFMAVLFALIIGWIGSFLPKK